MKNELLQIENHTTSSLKIFTSTLNSIQILPGINFVKSLQFEQLKQHPQYLAYIEKGFLSEVVKQNIKVDDRTNLSYIEERGELVPVSNAIVNNKLEPVQTDGGKIFKLKDLIETGISSLVAQNMIKFAPSEGWKDAEHVIAALEIESSNVDATKINEIFSK